MYTAPQSEKRRLLESGDFDEMLSRNVSVVMAFETIADVYSTETKRAAILYDNKKFYYYDSKIMYAVSTYPTLYYPEQWYHIMVSVKPSGDGALYINGEVGDNCWFHELI